jgi:hypothetical protein
LAGLAEDLHQLQTEYTLLRQSIPQANEYAQLREIVDRYYGGKIDSKEREILFVNGPPKSSE